MFSFFKSAPKWASALGYKDYKLLVVELEKFLKQRNISYKLSDDGKLQLGDLVYHLEELAIKCSRFTIDSWKELIDDYMSSIIDKHNFNSSFLNDSSNFKKLESFLSVKIFTSDSVEILGRDTLYTQKVFADFEKVLIFRFSGGSSYQTISPDIVASWGKTKEELFALAVDNYLKSSSLTLEKRNLAGIDLILCNYYDCANLLLDPSKIKDFQGKEGFLFIVPNEHLFCFYPINTAEVNTSLSVLIQLVMTQSSNKESSILDPNLYWYTNQGEVFKIPYVFSQENKLEINCPQEYVDMLERLPK